MDTGVAMFPTHDAIGPGVLAALVEERGHGSLWFPEHTHIPASRDSPFPGGGEMPRRYAHTYDLFVAMTAAAVATRRLRIASGICLIIERDPITTAKEVASIDHLSGGRVIFGIGGGWNAEEMGNHGTPFKERWKILRERVLAMKKIWSEDEASFDGSYVHFDPIWSWPKPVQKPHPPVVLGAHGPLAVKRVVDYCDGWIPIGVRVGDLKASLDELHRVAREKGRDPRTIQVSLFGAPADPDALRQLRDLGVARAIFALPPKSRDEVLPILDRYAAARRNVDA